MATDQDVTSNEFLLRCLQAAISDGDLVQDVLEAASLCNISAVNLANNDMDGAAVAERLFLTEDEALRLIAVCQEMIATGTVSAATIAGKPHHDEEAPIDGPLSPDEQQQQQDEEQEYAAVPALLAVVTEEDSAAPAEEQQQEPPSAKEAVAAPVPRTPVAAATDAAAPAPVAQLDNGPAPASPLLAHVVAATAVSTPLQVSRPGSAVGSVRASSPPPAARHVPSYLKPTAAAMARSKKEEDATSPRPMSASPNAAAPPSKKKNLFARIGSTFLAPTATFLARVTGNKGAAADEAQAHGSLNARHTVGSEMLKEVLSAPQGQRVTRPQPFKLAVDLRPKTAAVSQEELDLMEAKDKAWRPHQVPKFIKERKPAPEPSPRSAPKKPDEVFRPFNLASMERHAKMREAMAAKVAERKAKEEEARRFKATQLDKAKVLEAQVALSPRAQGPKVVTQTQAFNFRSEERVTHYHEVVEPKKKEREAEIAKTKGLTEPQQEKDFVFVPDFGSPSPRKSKAEREEEARLAKEAADMPVEEYRRKLEFKARKMPDFSAPFRPDPANAKSVTQSQEFGWATDKRLGKPQPKAGSSSDGLGTGVFDGDGYVCAFVANLRSSHSLAPGSLRKSSTLNGSSSMRQSINGPLGGGAGSPSASPAAQTLRTSVSATNTPRSASGVRRSMQSFGSASKGSASGRAAPSVSDNCRYGGAAVQSPGGASVAAN